MLSSKSLPVIERFVDIKDTKDYKKKQDALVELFEPLRKLDNVTQIPVVRARGYFPPKDTFLGRLTLGIRKASHCLGKLARIQVNPVELVTTEIVFIYFPIEILPLPDWKFGACITSMNIDFDYMEGEDQIKVLKALSSLGLEELVILDLEPTSMNVQALSEFSGLKRLWIVYDPAPDDGFLVFPELFGLEEVRIPCNYPSSRSVAFPDKHTVTKLHLDYFTLADPSKEAHPVGESVRELHTMCPYPQESLVFHFPNVESLDFRPTTGDNHIYDFVNKFANLTHLAICEVDEIHISHNHFITCPNLLVLDIHDVVLMEDKFWFWITKSFPGLTKLSIFTEILIYVNIPMGLNNALSSLKFFYCKVKLPDDFLDELRDIAPRVEKHEMG